MAEKPNFYAFEIGKMKALPSKDVEVRVKMEMGVPLHRVRISHHTLTEKDQVSEGRAVAIPAMSGGFHIAIVQSLDGEKFYAEDEHWHWPLTYEEGKGWKAEACISKKAMENFDG